MHTMRLLFIGLFVIAGCRSGGARATSTTPAPLTASERAEVVSLIEGDTGRGLYIADAEMENVTRALRLVRQAFPDGHDITPRRGAGLALQLTDSAARGIERRFPVGWQGDTVLRTLGIASIDSLHAALGVQGVELYTRKFGPQRTWFLAPAFPRPIYRNEAANRYSQIQDVRVDNAGFMLGDGGGLSLVRTATGYQFDFSRKWGDCLAGCIHGHVWVFDVNLRTNRVTKVRDSGDPWPIPPAA
jgi:hypothetical protein